MTSRPIVHELDGVRVEVGHAETRDDGEILLRLSSIPVGGRLIVEAQDAAPRVEVEIPSRAEVTQPIHVPCVPKTTRRK